MRSLSANAISLRAQSRCRRMQMRIRAKPEEMQRATLVMMTTAALALEHSGIRSCVRRHCAQNGHTHDHTAHVEEQREPMARRHQDHLQRKSDALRAVGYHHGAAQPPELGSANACCCRTQATTSAEGAAVRHVPRPPTSLLPRATKSACASWGTRSTSTMDPCRSS